MRKKRTLIDGELLYAIRSQRGLTQSDIPKGEGGIYVHETTIRSIENKNTRENRIAVGIEKSDGERLSIELSKEELSNLRPTETYTSEPIATSLGFSLEELITHWLHRREGGSTYAEAIDQNRLGIIGGKDPSEAFEKIGLSFLHSAKDICTESENEQMNMNHTVEHISKITDYWNRDNQNALVNQLVQISGQFSTLAPLLIGPPYLKRDIHHSYRKAQKDKGLSPDQDNANLSFTAGQMVWSPPETIFNWVYMGMYQSIVRNSIPVFVEPSYFESSVKPYLNKGCTQVVDAKIIGRATPLTAFSAILRSLRIPLHGIRPEILAEYDTDSSLGLFVTGTSGTRVDIDGPSTYLDGDIWIYVKSKKDGEISHHLGARFPNLADRYDFERCQQELEDEKDNHLKGREVMSSYDFKSTLLSSRSYTVTPESLLEEDRDEPLS
ncbi:MAG TPA: hypothetical protein DIT97_28495 [Gimesia maris]|uniref:Uncharacterized protein n=1 Tax=Gimesia maris TaxID=122 RepID=A0A3D3RF86_9PLAN|nr:hypothetical protein [Gimesia maris]|tara:strand:- start:685 stop:2001 length:1317 start_codon:yes stop_codon:yes gene_type:complete